MSRYTSPTIRRHPAEGAWCVAAPSRSCPTSWMGCHTSAGHRHGPPWHPSLRRFCVIPVAVPMWMDPLKFGVTEFPPRGVFHFGLSKTSTKCPARFSCCAAASPAGPLPMIHTRRPVRLAGGWGRIQPWADGRLVPIRCQLISIHKLLKASLAILLDHPLWGEDMLYLF